MRRPMLIGVYSKHQTDKDYTLYFEVNGKFKEIKEEGTFDDLLNDLNRFLTENLNKYEYDSNIDILNIQVYNRILF